MFTTCVLQNVKTFRKIYGVRSIFFRATFLLFSQVNVLILITNQQRG